MRVVLVTQTYDPGVNGQGRFAVSLAEGLARSGLAVSVIVPSERGQAYQTVRNGVHVAAVASISLAPFYQNAFVPLFPGREIAHLMDEFRPSLVHLQDHYPLCRAALKIARERQIPLVGTNHFLPENLLPYVPVLPHVPSGRQALTRLLWQSVLDVFSKLDIVTTPSETAAACLRKLGLGVPVRAISCGVDLGFFRPLPNVDRGQIRARYNLHREKLAFLYLGRLSPEKRLDTLLKAMHQLKRNDIQLAIAGQGPETARLKQLARDFGLEGQVAFLGFVAEEDLPLLLNSVDVFSMPSEAELLSLATLEAMATGRPILAARAGALPELVTDGENGLLFSPGDAEDAARKMNALAAQTHQLAAMGEASRRRASAHRIESTLHQYSELYHELDPGLPIAA